MTLLLKSKSISAGSVGNIHGNTGPNDYVAMLDFSRGQYFTRVGGVRTDYAVEDLINVARAGPANYQDRYGVWRESPMNSPRFKFSTEKDSYGLFVGEARRNYAASAVDGSSITVPNLGENEILLSWEGAGSATLTHANLTDKGVTSYRGRQMRWYTRTAGALTVTLNVAGSVTNLQVEAAPALLVYPSERLGYGEQLPIDQITFKSPLLDRVGADGTIFLRTMTPDSIIVSNNVYATGSQMIGLRTGSVDGGVYLSVADAVQVTPNGARHVPNGAAFTAGTQYTYNVSGRPTGTVRGLGWSNYGEELTGMTGGMFRRTTGLAGLGAFNAVLIGESPPKNFNGIITHCVIYDRHLSYDEMSIMATMWQN